MPAKTPRYSHTSTSLTLGSIPVDSGTVSIAFGRRGKSAVATLAENDALYSILREYAVGWPGTLWNRYTNSGIIKNPGGDGTCLVTLETVIVTLRRNCRWVDLATWNPARRCVAPAPSFFLARADAHRKGVAPSGEDAIAIARQRVPVRTLDFHAGDCGEVHVTGQVEGHLVEIERDAHRNGTLTIYAVRYVLGE